MKIPETNFFLLLMIQFKVDIVGVLDNQYLRDFYRAVTTTSILDQKKFTIFISICGHSIRFYEQFKKGKLFFKKIPKNYNYNSSRRLLELIQSPVVLCNNYWDCTFVRLSYHYTEISLQLMASKYFFNQAANKHHKNK